MPGEQTHTTPLETPEQHQANWMEIQREAFKQAHNSEAEPKDSAPTELGRASIIDLHAGNPSHLPYRDVAGTTLDKPLPEPDLVAEAVLRAAAQTQMLNYYRDQAVGA